MKVTVVVAMVVVVAVAAAGWRNSIHAPCISGYEKAASDARAEPRRPIGSARHRRRAVGRPR